MKKIFITALLLRVFLSFLVWHPDVNNHIDWGIRFWEYGPQKFFAPETNVWSYTWPNQPPGTIYIFALVRKLFEAIFNIFWTINVNIGVFPSGIITYFESNLYPALLKLPSILADLGIAYLIYKFVLTIHYTPITNHKKNLATLAAMIFLFNPVIWYNSSVWGQTDSVVNFFALLGFYLLFEKKLILALVSILFSFYIKASLLIFLPIFIIIAIRQKYKLSEYVLSIAYGLVPIALLSLPFSNGNPLIWLYEIYKDKVFTQQLQVITANAFNLWAGVAGIHERSHEIFLGPFSYKIWGIILFSLSYIPVLYLVYKKQDLKSIFWALSITALSSFMLLTNMHERYLYPFFPVFTVLAVLDMKLLPLYWTISGINLLNLYNFWWVPKIGFLVSFLSFGDRLMPRILGYFSFGIFIYLYTKFLRLLRARKI